VHPDRDEVSFGRPPGGRWRRPGAGWPGPRSRWLGGLLLAAALLAAIAAVVGDHSGGDRGSAHPVVSVTEVGHRLLGVTASWELFGRGPGRVVSIQFAAGRVTRTVVPPLNSGGPVSFLVGPGQAIIRPIDVVTGYRVPDGKPAAALTGLLGHGGPVVRGPDPRHVWVVTGSTTRPSLTLVNLAGKPGMTVQLPPSGPVPLTATSDGNGNVLLTGPGGTYDAGLGGVRPLSLQPTAVGPHRWLAVACHRPHRCRNVVVDSSTGARRVLPGPPVLGPVWPPGVISPDGSAAAVFVLGGPGHVSLHLISLSSGADHTVRIPASVGLADETLAWSPDSRWLFAVAGPGRVLAINARTRQVTGLGVRLPFISQIAIRNPA
jgi:hypothetical protein